MPRAPRKFRPSFALPPADEQPSCRLSRLKPRRDAPACVLLALLIAAIYLPVRGHEFINYDDDGYITGNEHVTDGLTWRGVVWAMTAVREANWHPLTWISHMVDWQLFGASAGGHHLVNVGFHIFNAVLIYCLLLRMTGAAWRCLVVAALFAVHPLHVESVAWAAERKDVLSTALGLAAVWTWLGYVERRSLGRYLAACALFAASLMAKPMLVTLPFLLLLFDYWPLGRFEVPDLLRGIKSRLSLRESSGRSCTTAPPGRRTVDGPEGPSYSATFAERKATLALLLEKLPLLALSFASCVVTVAAQSQGGAVVSMRKATIAIRFATVVQGYWMYLWKTFVPTGLAPIYPLHWDAGVDWPFTAACGAGLLITSSVVVVAAYWRRAPLAGWCWYLGLLVPVIGIVQVGLQSMADRYTYLPLVGVFIMLVWPLGELAAAQRAARVPLGALAVAVVVVLACLASRQVGCWAGSQPLFEHTLAVTEGNAVAHNNLAIVLTDNGQFDDAEWNLVEALRIDPTYIDAYGSKASLRRKQKRLPEAIGLYDRILQFHPQGDRAQKALMQRAQTWQERGEHARAEADLQAALRIDPSNSAAWLGLGMERQILGNTSGAVEGYVAAIRIRPNFGEAMNNLAWIRATHPDARFRDAAEAVALAERAARLPPHDPNSLDTLAAAYAEAGRFDEALRTIRQAIDEAKTEERPPMEQRAALYTQHRPHRDRGLLGENVEKEH